MGVVGWSEWGYGHTQPSACSAGPTISIDQSAPLTVIRTSEPAVVPVVLNLNLL